MITKHLTGKGETWPLYAAVGSLCNEYLYITSIMRFSPCELVSVCKPSYSLNLILLPLEQFTSSHKGNLQVLKIKQNL